jgi:hypothetical protein
MNDDEFAEVPIVQFVVSGLIVWCAILVLTSWAFGFL